MIFLYAWETIAHYNSVGNPSADSFVPINPLDTTLGATVTDFDLASMDHATWKCVEDAFHEYAALIFPAQDLSADE